MVNKVNKKNYDCDVVVVGAGMVGLSAVIALAKQGQQVVLVDAKGKTKPRTKAWDTRIFALTPSTEQWLRGLGVWALMDQSRVEYVEGMALWGQEKAAPLELHAENANLSTLASIVENQNVMHALWEAVEALDITVLTENACKQIDYDDNTLDLYLEKGLQISAKLLVAADGANSFIRKHLNISAKVKDFNQVAIVANYKAEKNHGHVARQWFAPHETLALLPLTSNDVSMVWAMSTNLAHELLLDSNEQLAKRVQAVSNKVIGELKPISQMLSFDLRQVTANKQIVKRVALVGDAAHQVHPMAGQGANLGFRDVMALEKNIAGSHGMQDIGDEVFLRKYERERKSDIMSMNMLTSGLNYLFAIESNLVKNLISIGMKQINKSEIKKSILIKQAVA